LLVLAGRDPTGGAGVDADRESAAELGVDALLVVTADTDQDGLRVRAVLPRDPAEWSREARAAARAAPPQAVKTGLLPGAAHVRAAADLADELAVPLVVDPVLSASAGEIFQDQEGVEALLEALVPRAAVLTPNVPETARLTGLDEAELAGVPGARVVAARALLARGARAVIVKGGHGEEDPVRDLLLAAGQEPCWLAHRRVAGASLHGSGCRYAAAVAAGLALGRPLERAARDAAALVLARLAPPL
jgi:hydroxymethylpyrimidine/phosphomethylpyrimidine kinase